MTHILRLFLSVSWLSCSQNCVLVRCWYSAVALSSVGPSSWDAVILSHRLLGGPQLVSLSVRRSAERRRRIRLWLRSWGTRNRYQNSLISGLKRSFAAFQHFSTLPLNFLAVNNTLLSWLGHLERMEEDGMPRKITQELEGTRRRERPRKGWKEEVERDLQVLGVRRWRELVADRKKRKDTVRQAKAHSGL